MTTTNKQKERERERERERPMIVRSIDFIFFKNATVFIFKKTKIPKNCIYFLYSNFFLTKNKNGTQIQNQTSFLVLNSTKTENKYKIQNFFAQTKRTLRLP